MPADRWQGLDAEAALCGGTVTIGDALRRAYEAGAHEARRVDVAHLLEQARQHRDREGGLRYTDRERADAYRAGAVTLGVAIVELAALPLPDPEAPDAG